MRENFSWRLVPAASLLLALTGCATSEVTGFETFAAAGTQYTQAVDALLTRAGEIAVDTNSEQLLESRDLAPVPRSAFAEQDAAMRANLEELRLLARQTDLLGDYFTTLASLAGSDAPDAFATQLETTATALDGLSQTLRGRGLAQDPQALASLAGGVGGLVVKGIQAAALEKELARRKQTIAEVLLLQESLLQALRGQVTADAQFTTDRLYEKTVVAPFLDPGQLTTDAARQAWMAQRRALLGQPVVVQQLDAAASAAQNLRQAWVKLLSHELTAADVQAVAGELQPILASLDTLKAEGTTPSGGH